MVLKAGYFRFCGVLSMFPFEILYDISQGFPKTCVDSAPCCVLSAGVPLCDSTSVLEVKCTVNLTARPFIPVKGASSGK